MAIKDVLLYLDNDAECRQRVNSAIDLCNHHQAHLAGVYMHRRFTTPSYVAASLPVAVFEASDSLNKSMRDSAETEFNSCLNEANASGEFRSMDGGVYHTIAVHSRYVDLLIVPQEVDNDGLNENFNIGDALVASACPVLMVPNQNVTKQPTKRALVAWDDSRECARALHALLALQMPLEKIDIVSVAKQPAVAIDITQHVNRHGIEAEAHLLEDDDDNVCSRLLDIAATLDSELIVMGAYGHSRISEWVFGGTTKRMLENAELPVLFAH